MNRFLKPRSSILVVFSSLLIGTLAFAETKKEPTQTFPLQAGGYLSLENINGDVTIEGWKKNEVSISAVKNGSSKDLDRIEVVVEVDKYEGKDWIHIGTEYVESRGGFLNFLKNAGSVDYAIKAPSDAILEDVELVNGNLKVTGITGYLSLGTVNGSITATETLNGNISSEFGLTVEKGQWVGRSMKGLVGSGGARITIETVNGNIDVKKR
jgi:DUF4097 and DUF4098 domain-containing protein YvlB